MGTLLLCAAWMPAAGCREEAEPAPAPSKRLEHPSPEAAPVAALEPRAPETMPAPRVREAPRDIPGVPPTGQDTAATPAPTRPAAASTAAEMTPLAPLRSAAVGTWARYQMLGDRRMRLRIVEATDREVTIEVEMILNGQPLVLPATRKERRDLNRPRRHARRVGAKLTVMSDRIQAADRVWSARRLDATWTDEEIAYHRTTWIAEDAPIDGIVKMVQTADGKPVAAMELIDFGTARPATTRAAARTHGR